MNKEIDYLKNYIALQKLRTQSYRKSLLKTILTGKTAI